MGDYATDLIEMATELGNISGINALGSVSGGAITVQAPSVNGVTTATLAAATTITLPTPAAGASVKMLLTQDSTGSRLVTWASAAGAVQWPAKTAPTLSTAAGRVDLIEFKCVDGTNWIGSSVINVG